jgi:L-fucose mutarotase
MGHNSWILLSDGGFPHITASNPAAEKVWLNLTPGVLTVPQVLDVLKATVPIEQAAVMTPPDGKHLPIHADYQRLIPDVPFDYVPQLDFYDRAKQPNVGLVIATGEVRNFGNLLLKMGSIKNNS